MVLAKIYNHTDIITELEKKHKIAKKGPPRQSRSPTNEINHEDEDEDEDEYED